MKLLLGILLALVTSVASAQTPVIGLPIGGVTKIDAGTGINISPGSGVGEVTISATGTSGVTSLTGDGILYNNSASTGAVTLTFATQAANCFLAGPTSGSPATPTCRALVNGDFPSSLAPVFSGANLTGAPAFAITNMTGTGTNLTFVNPALGTPASGVATNLTGAPAFAITNMTGTGTNLTFVNPALGTPASGIITNFTGTCSTCVANSAGSVTNALTLNNSNSGAASGSTYNGGSAVTLSANTLGAGSLANANTWSAAQTISVAGAASTPSMFFTGTILTGGTGTTNFPHIFFQHTGTAVTSWGTNGTLFGANFDSGYTGLIFDFRINGAAASTSFSVDRLGTMVTGPNGSLSTPSLVSNGATAAWELLSSAATIRIYNAGILSWSSTGAFGGAQDIGFDRSAAGVVEVNLGTAAGSGGSLKAQKILTSTNCANGASPAVCASASAGAVAIPTGVNPTLVVNTTAVTAASQIVLVPDDSLTIASTTCNSTLATLAGGMAVTARTAATSFTISFNGTITTNPVCVSYTIIN